MSNERLTGLLLHDDTQPHHIKPLSIYMSAVYSPGSSWLVWLVRSGHLRFTQSEQLVHAGQNDATNARMHALAMPNTDHATICQTSMLTKCQQRIDVSTFRRFDVLTYQRIDEWVCQRIQLYTIPFFTPKQMLVNLVTW